MPVNVKIKLWSKPTEVICSWPLLCISNLSQKRKLLCLDWYSSLVESSCISFEWSEEEKGEKQPTSKKRKKGLSCCIDTSSIGCFTDNPLVLIAVSPLRPQSLLNVVMHNLLKGCAPQWPQKRPQVFLLSCLLLNECRAKVESKVKLYRVSRGVSHLQI